METKVCSKCKEEKLLDMFNIVKLKYISSYCKQCKKEYHKKYVIDNKEYLIDYSRKYREDNKEEVSEYKKIWYEYNKDKLSEKKIQRR